MIAIAMEMVRSEYLLVEVDDAEQRGKYILYQHAEFFYYAPIMLLLHNKSCY